METVVKESLRELIDYEWLIVSLFEKNVCLTNSFICKIKGEIGTDKIRKILLSFPNINPSWLIWFDAHHEESIKNELYAIESDTRKNGELKVSLKHTLYIASLLEKHQRNTRMKLARAVLSFLQCSHRKDFATLNIC